MLPEVNMTTDSLQEYAYPNRTYRINFESKRIAGMVDGVEAIRQAIHKIIQTERYADIIYSWNYGSELEKFIGKDFDYIKAATESAVRAALLMDDRITDIKDFIVTKQGIDSCLITFIAKTTEGDAQVEEAMRI